MSVSEHSSNTAPRASERRGRRATVAQRFLRAVERWHQRRAVAVLRVLDDRLLEDIGLARGDLPRLAERSYRRDRASTSAAHASGQPPKAA